MGIFEASLHRNLTYLGLIVMTEYYNTRVGWT